MAAMSESSRASTNPGAHGCNAIFLGLPPFRTFDAIASKSSPLNTDQFTASISGS